MSWKLSRTVLKPSRGGDASAQGNYCLPARQADEDFSCRFFKVSRSVCGVKLSGSLNTHYLPDWRKQPSASALSLFLWLRRER